MPIPVQCQQCEAKFLIEDRFAGKRAKCKRCGSIMPIPAGGGASEETGEIPVSAPAPADAPARKPLQGVTSMPGRAWRPQDVVIEREGDVQEFAVSGPAAPQYPRERPVGRTLDVLIPVLLLLYAGALIYLGISTKAQVASLVPPNVLEAADGWIMAQVWTHVALNAVGTCVIVGPLIMGAVAIGLSVRKHAWPTSAYLRACALAAVPGVVFVLLALARTESRFNTGGDNNATIGMVLVAAVVGFYFAVRFILGLDWATAGVCFAFALVLGTVGMFVSAVGAKWIAKESFEKRAQDAVAQAVQKIRQEEMQKMQASRAAGRSAPRPAPSPSAGASPPTPPPAVARATAPPVVIAPTPPAPAPAPTRGVPVAPPSKLFDPGDGLDSAPPANPPTPVVRDVTPIPVETRFPPQDFAAIVRESAGPVVSGVEVLPLSDKVISIIHPATPSSAFAVVSGGAGDETVEVYDGTPPKQTGAGTYKIETHSKANYALSPDGQRLLRIASFPKLSARATLVKDGTEIGAVELDSAFGEPTLLGVLSADRILIRWTSAGKHGLEVWDLRTRRHGRRVELPDHDPSAGNEAISPDGKLFATATRVNNKSAIILHPLFEGGASRRLPIDALDSRWSIRPAGIAFTPDGGKVAALFIRDGNGLVVAWNVKSGKVLSSVLLAGAVQPLEQLSGAPGHGRALGGGPRSIDWLGENAWLVSGSSVVNAADGSLLAELGASDVFDQSVVNGTSVHLGIKPKLKPAEFAVITIESKKLPAGKAPGTTAPTAK